MSQRWIIPDIHGCPRTLKLLLENTLKVTKHDQLYFLGDYIDRGPDGKGVIDYLMHLQNEEYNVHFIKGNHEDMCVKAFEADQKKKLFGGKHPEQKDWEAVGAKKTLESFGVKHPREIPKQYIDWMNNCLPFIELEEYILVHAGMNFSIDNPFEDTKSMMWTRQVARQENHPRAHSRRLQFHEFGHRAKPKLRLHRLGQRSLCDRQTRYGQPDGLQSRHETDFGVVEYGFVRVYFALSAGFTPPA